MLLDNAPEPHTRRLASGSFWCYPTPHTTRIRMSLTHLPLTDTEVTNPAESREGQQAQLT